MMAAVDTSRVIAAIREGVATEDDVSWARRRLDLLRDYHELAVTPLSPAQVQERDALTVHHLRAMESQP